MNRILFVPDTHAPYVDALAWAVFLKAARVIQPQTIVIMGDFADCYAVSSHVKAPRLRGKLLLEEINEVKPYLNDLDKLKATEKVYIEGNHEDRLTRYLATGAPELDGCATIPQLLNLKERGWKWVKYRSSYKLGRIHVTHDTGTAGPNAHRQAANDHHGSCVIGHTHRMAYEVRGTYGGLPFLSAMFGWLGDAKTVEYLHGAKVSHWVHGFGVGYVLDDGIVHVQPVPIVDGACVVQGKLVSV